MPDLNDVFDFAQVVETVSMVFSSGSRATTLSLRGMVTRPR